MEDQTWDNEADTPGSLSVRNAWQTDDGDDNVKENWFDEDEPVVMQPIKEMKPASAKGAKKSSKIAGSKKESNEDERQLTAKELEEIQKKADLAIARETFRMDEEALNSLDSLNDSTEDHDHMARVIAEKVMQYKEMDGYVDFLEKMFHEICLSVHSEGVRKIARNLQSLGTEMSKLEKEQQKTKNKKKNTIKKVRDSDFLDELDARVDKYDYLEDEEDFM